SLRSEREKIFSGLAIDKKSRAARHCRGSSGPRAVAFFADNEEQSEIARTRGQKFLRRGDHRGDDALGIAGTAAPDEIAVLVCTKKRWNGIHVRGKCHHWLSPARKDIVAIRLGGDALDLPTVQSRASRQMREQVVAHIFF